MVKRYNVGYGMAEAADSPTGKFVLASDFDRMRRRLVVKLLRERIEYKMTMSFRYRHLRSYAKSELCDRQVKWFRALADALTRNEPLEYFNRLGQDK